MLPDGTIFEDEDFDYVDEKETDAPWDVDVNKTTASTEKSTIDLSKTIEQTMLLSSTTTTIPTTTTTTTTSAKTTTATSPTTTTTKVVIKETLKYPDVDLTTTPVAKFDVNVDGLPNEPDYYNTVVTDRHPGTDVINLFVAINAPA
jgi:hypothetical protein